MSERYWMSSVDYGCELPNGWTPQELVAVHFPTALAQMLPQLEGKVQHESWSKECERQVAKIPRQISVVEHAGFTFRLFTAAVQSCGPEKRNDWLEVTVCVNGEPYRIGEIMCKYFKYCGDDKFVPATTEEIEAHQAKGGA